MNKKRLKKFEIWVQEAQMSIMLRWSAHEPHKAVVNTSAPDF